jgi:serine/threonine-protein kinase
MVRCNYRDRYQSAAEILRDINSYQFDKIVTDNFKNKPSNKMRIVLAGLGITIIGIAGILLGNFKGEKYIAYENNNYGIKLDYPEKWSMQEEEDFLNPGLVFVSPLESDRDKFQEKVRVSV